MDVSMIMPSKEYYANNKEKCREYDKEYREKNKELIARRGKEWRKNNPKKCRNYNKKWKENNKELNLEIHKKWYENNREECLKTNKKWRQDHPLKIKTSNMKRKRELGYNPLNEKFPGSVGHHINRNDVVFIPEGLHKSISHSQNNLESMEKINTLAIEYL